MLIYDNHIHFHDPDTDIDAALADFQRADIEKFCFLSLGNPNDFQMNQNAQGLWFKREIGEAMYLFAACEYAFAEPNADPTCTIDFPAQVKRMVALGIDGWKLLESKIGSYKKPLNGEFYAPLFAALEEARLPLLWHVGDPIEFWDVNTRPEWAPEKWCYDETDPTLESLRAEALEVVARHPNLPIILAHMFFLSYDLDRAAKILDDHPHVMFDLAPGVEMFFGFSQDVARSREFFTNYSDRILFGTDRGVAEMPAKPRAAMIRRFLETSDHFDPPHRDVVMWPDSRAPIKGIALDAKIVQKICRDNFIGLVGVTPKPQDETAALAEVERLANAHGADSVSQKILSRWREAKS